MNKLVLAAGLLLTVPLMVLLGVTLGRDARAAGPSPLVGRTAPAFELEALRGAKVSLGELAGKPVVINFWATWCEPCRAEHEVLRRAATTLGGHVSFVGIAFDSEREQVDKYLSGHGQASYPILLDDGGRVAIAYGVRGVPETYFVDRAGVVRSKVEGPLTPGQLNRHLQPLLEEP